MEDSRFSENCCITGLPKDSSEKYSAGHAKMKITYGTSTILNCGISLFLFCILCLYFISYVCYTGLGVFVLHIFFYTLGLQVIF